MGAQLRRDDVLGDHLVRPARGGFTLVEAIIALTLSSILVVLISTTFLVQNEYYAVQAGRSQAHDNVRMVTEIIGSDVRSVMRDGVQLAQNKRFIFSTPMVVAVVCATQGRNTQHVYLEGGKEAVDTAEFSGFAVRDSSDAWSFFRPPWGTIDANGGNPAAQCAQNGADTTGVSEDYARLRNLQAFLGGQPALGTVIMFFRTIEYRFETSTMDSSTVGLFRGVFGEDLTEYATGMDTTAQFLYRTGGSTYTTNVSGGAGLGSIDAVRIVAEARKRVAAGGVADVTYGWSVNIPLRNAN